MNFDYIKKLFRTEREADLIKIPDPQNGQVDLSVFERETENRIVDNLSVGLNGVLGVGYGESDDYSGDVKSLIKKYREMALAADINDAIDETVNEAIVKTENTTVELDLEETQLSDRLKETIIDEFQYLLKVMDFQYKGDEYFRQWYVDGRLYSQNLYNTEDRTLGITNFNILSPFNLQRIKTKEGNQLYLYQVENENNHIFSNLYKYRYNGFIIPDEHINFTPSGLKDVNEKYYISHLHKAIIPFNQLKLLEDASVIYTMTRAVERRHFTVKTGKLNQAKAEAQVKKAMDAFKNRVVYDRNTGSVLQRKDVMTITEDFWSAASDDGRGVDITPIQGGTQLRDMVDNMDYYKRNLLRSLKVPYGRMDVAGSTISYGDNSKEISREELRFSKFVNGLRDKFSRGLFIPMLKKHLYLKGILDLDEFDDIYNEIRFDWVKDQYFEEIAKQERLKGKIEMLGAIDSYVGKDKYFSKNYVYSEILDMTPEDVKEMYDDSHFENGEDNNPIDDTEDRFNEVPEDGAIDMEDEVPTEEPTDTEDTEETEEPTPKE